MMNTNHYEYVSRVSIKLPVANRKVQKAIKNYWQQKTLHFCYNFTWSNNKVRQGGSSNGFIVNNVLFDKCNQCLDWYCRWLHPNHIIFTLIIISLSFISSVAFWSQISPLVWEVPLVRNNKWWICTILQVVMFNDVNVISEKGPDPCCFFLQNFAN